MYSSINSFGLIGISCYPVSVEVDISRGMPVFDIVGLPDASVKEARDRVRSAMRNNSLSLPERKIVINLSPADTKKTGPLYDLPILVGILVASGELSDPLDDMGFVGEISLDGTLNPINGIISMVIAAKEQGLSSIFIPEKNAAEGSAINGISVFVARNVRDVIAHLRGELRLPLASELPILATAQPTMPDMRDVRGQPGAKRAAEIAAAGGHNLLLLGPPGSGKSMVAKRLPSILPDLTEEEAIEATKIHSISGLLPPGASMLRQRPFRSPHHSISTASFVGGGSNPRPGEVSLAHNGVLFLDEFPEFSRSSLEVLRQPLEDGQVNLSRVSGRITYPSRIMLVAAMNPCPCGYYGTADRECICSDHTVKKYLGRISGPILDRLDIQVELPAVSYQDISSHSPEESSANIKERVNAAREIQRKRLEGTGFVSNSQIPEPMLRDLCAMDSMASQLLETAFNNLSFSGRSYNRVLKLSRTIADLDGSKTILSSHVLEALQYRSLDRKYWGRR